MKLTRLALAAVGSAALFTVSTAKAQTFADWTFTSDTIATNNNPIADTGVDGQTGNDTAAAGSLGMATYATPNVGVTTDDVLVGKSSDTGANGVADTGNQWRVRGQAGSNGAANGWSSLAPIGTQGATFSASTVGSNAGATSVQVSFDWYSTTQGEANLEFLYSTNGGSNWIQAPLTLAGSDAGLVNATGSSSDTNTTQGAYVSDNLLKNGSSAGQDWFTGLTATINDPNALNDAGFEVEMVNASTGADDVSTQGTALNNNSGNWRFDNIVVQAVPEPSSWVLGLGAVALFFVVRRIRRA